MPPAKPRDPRSRLTREQILDTAWAELDAHGLDAFTMRRLAERLGVAPMTLYGYYANKDAILDAVIDLGAERLAIAPASGPWRQRLTQLLTVMHDQLRAHPFIVELRLRRPILSRGALRFTEAGVAVLIDAGLDPAEAARAFRPLFVYAFGAAAFGHPSGYAGAAERSGQALAALDAEEFPALTALPDEAVLSLADDGQFASGLALLLDGVEARIASRGLPA